MDGKKERNHIDKGMDAREDFLQQIREKVSNFFTFFVETCFPFLFDSAGYRITLMDINPRYMMHGRFYSLHKVLPIKSSRHSTWLCSQFNPMLAKAITCRH